MRHIPRRILVAAALVLAASLFGLRPLDPELDPAWWLLGGFRNPPPASKDIIVFDAPPEMALSPGELALDLRELAEFDSGNVIVDLPVDWAAGDAAPIDALVRLRSSIDTEFTGIDNNLRNFWQGLRSGSLRAVDAGSGFSALEELVRASRERLLSTARADSAELPSLEAALALHSEVWFCLGLKALPEAPSDAESSWMDSAALSASASLLGVTGANKAWSLPRIAGLSLPPPELIPVSAGMGFSLRDELSSPISRDFALARFTPLASYEGRIILHPALRVLAKRLGAKRIELDATGIRLVGLAANARADGGDVLIPLDREGRAILGPAAHEGSWPPRLPLSALDDYREAEARVVERVGALEKAGLLVDRSPPTMLWRRASALGRALINKSPSPASADADAGGVTSSIAAATPLVANPSPSLAGPLPAQASTPSQSPSEATSPLAAWVAAKSAFFEAASAALDERGKMDELLAGLLSTPGLADRERSGVEALREKADKAFGSLARAIDDWKASKMRLSQAVYASLVIIGEAPYRSRGGFIPVGGASPVDPSGDMAAFIRAGSLDSFIAVAGAFAILPVSLLAGFLLALLLAFARARFVLAAGLLAAAALVVFSGIVLSQAGIWWSPTVPLVAVLLPGLAGLAREALLKAFGQGQEVPRGN